MLLLTVSPSCSIIATQSGNHTLVRFFFLKKMFTNGQKLWQRSFGGGGEPTILVSAIYTCIYTHTGNLELNQMLGVLLFTDFN